MSYPDFLLQNVVDEHDVREEYMEENLYHVSDLCYCPQKRVFEHKYPGLYQVKPYMIMGTLVEKGVQHYLQSDEGVQFNIRETRPLGKYTVTGEVDILYPDKVIDVKSPKKMFENKLHGQYKRQVRLYMWLFEKPKGEVWYATRNWLGKKKVNMGFKDAQVKELIEEDTCPLYPEWECSYCQWKGFCPYAVIKK